MKTKTGQRIFNWLIIVCFLVVGATFWLQHDVMDKTCDVIDNQSENIVTNTEGIHIAIEHMLRNRELIKQNEASLDIYAELSQKEFYKEINSLSKAFRQALDNLICALQDEFGRAYGKIESNSTKLTSIEEKTIQSESILENRGLLRTTPSNKEIVQKVLSSEVLIKMYGVYPNGDEEHFTSGSATCIKHYTPSNPKFQYGYAFYTAAHVVAEPDPEVCHYVKCFMDLQYYLYTPEGRVLGKSTISESDPYNYFYVVAHGMTDAGIFLVETNFRMPIPAIEVLRPEERAKIYVGQELAAMGCPLGQDPIISFDGVITGIRKRIFSTYLFQMNAYVTYGCSGGAILDKYGRQMGVICAMRTEDHWMSYFISLDKFDMLAEMHPRLREVFNE